MFSGCFQEVLRRFSGFFHEVLRMFWWVLWAWWAWRVSWAWWAWLVSWVWCVLWVWLVGWVLWVLWVLWVWLGWRAWWVQWVLLVLSGSCGSGGLGESAWLGRCGWYQVEFQLKVWILIIQKSTVIPPSLMVLFRNDQWVLLCYTFPTFVKVFL